MPASYPSGVFNPATRSNGQVIQDTWFNDPSAEIIAVENALLTSGLAHDLVPDSTVDARALGSTAKVWGHAYLKSLTLGASTELTIAAGVVTATAGYFSVDTEANAAADDLDTITAGSGAIEGSIVILRAENVARIVTVKDGTGNLLLRGDCPLSATDRTLTLLYDGTNWRELARSVIGDAAANTVFAGPTSG